MFDKYQPILTRKPAATALALVLFAGFTAPFVALQQFAHADPAVLPCTVANYNGCTELSPVPPEDPKAVPPNLLLMLDDSGSMLWDFMPDWTDIQHGSWTTSYNTGEDDKVSDPRNNGLWYDPTVEYKVPPKANGSLYPTPGGMASSWNDGFNGGSTADPAWLTRGTSGGVFPANLHYNRNLVGATSADTTYVATYKCPAGYAEDPTNPDNCKSTQVYVPPSQQPAVQQWWCNLGGSGPAAGDKGPQTCTITVVSGETTTVTTYAAIQRWVCTKGTIDNGVTPPICNIGAVIPPGDKPKTWQCVSGGTGPVIDGEGNYICTIKGTPATVGAFIYIDPRDGIPHFITSNGSHGNCDGVVAGGTWNYPDADKNCVKWDDVSGKGAPTGIRAGTNVSIWYSYYRTRILMAKSALMIAFSEVKPDFRVGFGSINGTAQTTLTGLKIKTPTLTAIPTYTFDDATTGGGRSDNKLAAVQAFGDGTANTQRANFWTWLAKVAPANQTPLRKALQGVGEYYKTSQPWSAMPTDPGYVDSTTKFACRASYTILTTDGFWNGADPSDIGSAADTDGPVQTVPADAVTQYKAVAPYTGGGVGSGVSSLADVATYYWENDLNTDLVNEVSTSNLDPASWQHMTTFTVGMGYDPVGISPSTATINQIFNWARGSGAAISGFSWPTPASNSLNNIADLAHAAVNGHGDFFNAHSPQQLADAFAKMLRDISARTVAPTPATVNASVLSIGALTFGTGYNTADWAGTMQAVALKNDGTVGSVLWKAGQQLDVAYHSPTAFSSRTVYTGAYDPSGTGTYSTFQFNAANVASLDATEISGLQTPALAGGDDTLDNRIKYLLGDNTYEGAVTGTVYRTRTSILGAVIRSDPVYVSSANGGYRDSWPAVGASPAPESSVGAQAYSAFVVQESTRKPTVYVGANDGMLHAFYAPIPTCTGTIDADGNCPTFTSASGAGAEMWAFMPRAVYANLGNMTDPATFTFLPTVDATPVTRDVFSSGDQKWHTLLAGGVGLGGRGVYGIDVTSPDPTDGTNPFTAAKVLWEFDADMAVDTSCKSNSGSCRGTDLGFTVGQPNIGRLANGKWVVLVPNGYFPDCSLVDFPTRDLDSCDAISAQAPLDATGKPYSALFVLDAMTGKMIAELKTPTTISGVTSFGLATPVLGDYGSDQVDDVAFAGDVQGNLWRFDLSDPSPANWTVSLVYQGLAVSGKQGVQPITTMPRLFPDPTTNRFIVAFGTGKYLGLGDNNNTTIQAIYGVRDVAGTTYTQANLTQQFLHETVVPSGEPNAGASLRCITGAASDSCTTDATPINAVPSTGGGWYINLRTTNAGGTWNDKGERVVVTPAAVFASNTAVFQSLITGAESIDACNPSTQGAVMAVSATSGAPGGVSSLGPWPIAGGRIVNARTRGSLPLISPISGGKAYLPTALLSPSGTSPIAIDAPIPRRRSWRELLTGQ